MSTCIISSTSACPECRRWTLVSWFGADFYSNCQSHRVRSVESAQHTQRVFNPMFGNLTDPVATLVRKG